VLERLGEPLCVRKTTRDTAACETGQRCAWTWNSSETVTGDTVVLLGDSVYVFRESAHDAAVTLQERAGVPLRLERLPWKDSLPVRRP
jgi:hypothetical protein